MSAKIEGARQLDRRLDALTKQAAGRIVVNAIKAGAEVIRVRTEELAPVGKTGNLKQNIIKVVLEKGRHTATVGVGWSDKAWYGLFPELGTKHHSAKPFLRPAFDGQKDAAIAAAGAELRRGIDRARKA